MNEREIQDILPKEIEGSTGFDYLEALKFLSQEVFRNSLDKCMYWMNLVNVIFASRLQKGLNEFPRSFSDFLNDFLWCY